MGLNGFDEWQKIADSIQTPSTKYSNLKADFSN